jgi:tetratricopeptide (TPR) repeat protein
VNKRKNSPVYRRPAFWLAILIVIAASISGWWLWRGLYVTPPRLNFILLTVNKEPQKILSGEILALHPKDRIKIVEISTNVPFNLFIRLVARDLDVNALRYEEMSLSELLPEKNVFDHYRFRIWVKDRNQDLGYVDWKVQPYADDWLDKADRIIDAKQRLVVLERSLRLLPEDSQIKRRLLEEYKSQKLWEQAVRMLEDMAGKELDQDILLELLDVYTAMQSKDGIVSVLKRLVNLNPDDLEIRNELAEALEKRGKLKAAAKEYEALLRRMEEEDKLPVYKRLGYLYAKTGPIKKAISYYLKALKIDKRDVNLYYNLSYLYERNNQKDKADFYLGKAIGLKSEDTESRLKLAHRMIEKGEFEKAEKYLTQVLKKNANSLKALLLMAQLMEKRGEKEAVRGIYKKILLQDPKNETVIYNLGALEYGAGNLDASLNHFKNYVKSHPKDAAAHGILFDIYKKQKKADMAFKQARILVELRPGKVEPYHYIFDYLNGLSDYNRIIHFMDMGLEANPNQTDLRAYMVLAYVKTGKDELAIKQIEEILKVRPEDVNLLMHLARLREKNGNLGGALETYKRIISISPGHEDAEEAYLRLRLRRVQDEGAE